MTYIFFRLLYKVSIAYYDVDWGKGEKIYRINNNTVTLKTQKIQQHHK